MESDSGVLNKLSFQCIDWPDKFKRIETYSEDTDAAGRYKRRELIQLKPGRARENNSLLEAVLTELKDYS